MIAYVTDETYNRADIHAAAKQAGLPPGNATAGITVVGTELCVFWNPYRALYANKWIREPDEFIYSGEGSVGPMQDSGGNVKLRLHSEDRVPVPVFYKVQRTGSNWLHLGRFTVEDVIAGVSQDAKGELREDIRFRFLRTTKESISEPLPKTPKPSPPVFSEPTLWVLCVDEAAKSGGKRKRATKVSTDRRVSNPALTAYVVQRAIDHGGACESCGIVPNWTDDVGLPHFQAHHIDPDIDLVDWIGAVCGTCHDRLHHGSDRRERATSLRELVVARQQSAGREIYYP